MGKEITVIGAGIIGLSLAVELGQRGFCVRVLDRTAIAAGATRGLAGAYAFGDVIPLATPGLWRKIPGWLLDPLGPLSIDPHYLPRLLPWMVRFWRASWPDRFARALRAQAGLMALSRAALERQIVHVGGEGFMHRDGQIQLYEGERAFAASRPGWVLREGEGISFRVLRGRAEIAQIQPGLAPCFTHAVVTPDWINVSDPLRWAQHLAAQVRAQGGVIEYVTVHALSAAKNKTVIRCQDKVREAEQVVVACGAWSHHLARSVGERFPLDTERGYNTTFSGVCDTTFPGACDTTPARDFSLKLQLTFPDHGFVVSKLGEGVRVGGAVEFAGLTRAPDFRRAEILCQKAARFLPQLDLSGGVQWMGCRPSLPDSLPVLGASRKARGVFYAFGHGHLGLTQSAGTAEILSDLITGRTPDLPPDVLRAFSPQRFL